VLHHGHRGGSAPVSEIAHWKFRPGKISEQLMADYTAEVQVAQ
jgi:hypothetical protein